MWRFLAVSQIVSAALATVWMIVHNYKKYLITQKFLIYSSFNITITMGLVIIALSILRYSQHSKEQLKTIIGKFKF